LLMMVMLLLLLLLLLLWLLLLLLLLLPLFSCFFFPNVGFLLWLTVFAGLAQDGGLHRGEAGCSDTQTGAG
jgi:hypothetical protein